MNKVVIDIRNLSKLYRLGTISTGTLYRDLSSLWAKYTGKEDPNSIITATSNDLRSFNGEESIWALKDINFEIKEGEILGIIGKNGAGKSTLLKILSRITSPSTGEIRINGRSGSLLEVGTGFHPELSGKENIYLNGAILGMTKSEINRKLDEIIDFSGIEKYIDTPIKRYSTGMKVRLGFSVAAFLQVEILMVDEVLAVGDAEFQFKAMGKMNEVSNMDGKTILFVSHNIKAIKSLTQRCLLLSNGTVEKLDKTGLVINSYLQKQCPNAGYIDRVLVENNLIKFINIKLLDKYNIEKQLFPYHEEVKIYFQYYLKQKTDQLRISFNISDTYSNVIFTSVDFPKGKRAANLDMPGNYEAFAIIPANFFNEGTYFIGLSCDVPFKKIIFNEKNIFSFNITFPKALTASLNEKFEGCLFPKIDWKTKKNEKLS